MNLPHKVSAPEESAPQPPGTAQNPPEPQQGSSREPSGTSQGICTGTSWWTLPACTGACSPWSPTLSCISIPLGFIMSKHICSIFCLKRSAAHLRFCRASELREGPPPGRVSFPGQVLNHVKPHFAGGAAGAPKGGKALNTVHFRPAKIVLTNFRCLRPVASWNIQQLAGRHQFSDTSWTFGDTISSLCGSCIPHIQTLHGRSIVGISLTRAANH